MNFGFFFFFFPTSTSFVKGTGNYVKTLVAFNQRQNQISKREEGVKEKIILSQEKNIHRLNELVRSLQQQLLQCRGNNETTNGTVSRMTEHVIELERQQILDD
ncbi:hypothetical protein LWI28_013965 [Acer negundo]|uniref:Uncharacterized protein n=1 Tax=Acer negundo TaxID=4023 RepID=A0AAD5JE99_ACENE|nr:hypothetical protein LWI28_013965 [Acer negundo]